jgi:hypoxanthine-guanine phosphoribosyltransferase
MSRITKEDEEKYLAIEEEVKQYYKEIAKQIEEDCEDLDLLYNYGIYLSKQDL